MWTWVGVIVAGLLHAGCVGPTLGISLAGDGVGSVTSNPSGIDCGDTCAMLLDVDEEVTLTATPALGSRFAGWTGGGCSGVEPCTMNLSTNTRVTATFEALPPRSYGLAVSRTGEGRIDANGIACGGDCEEDYVEGTSVALLASPSVGWQFVTWRGAPGCDSSPTCMVTIAGPVALEAVFALAPKLLVASISSSGSALGSVSTSPAGIAACTTECSHEFPHGTEVTLTATPNVGSTFAGWTGACSGTASTCTVTMTQPQSVIATFAPPPAADLSLGIDASPASVAVGGTLTYANRVTNLGPASASQVTITNTLPAGVAFISASGSGWSCSVMAQVVTCTTTTLAFGAAPDVTIKATAPASTGVITDSATVSASTSDPSMANNSGTAQTTVIAAPSGTFGGQATYPTGIMPHSVQIADFNHDGKGDLAVANVNDGFANPGNAGTVSVLLGTGNGTFQPAVSYAAGAVPISIAIADLDKDGSLDLAVVLYGSNGAVAILRGNGDGTFQPAMEFPAFANPRSVAIGDLDGDSKLDLAVAISNVGRVLVLRGNGDATFQTAVGYDIASDAYSIAIGDLDGDLHPDLVAAGYPNVGSASVLLNNGDGTFAPSVEYPAGENPISIVIGDVNGDAKPDLVAAAMTDSTVEILLGNGNGTFQPPVSYATGGGPYMVALADIDSDGDLDVATADLGGNSVSILRGQGNGTFGAPTSYAAGTNPRGLAVGELNGDWRLDLAVANFGSNTVSVLLGI